MRGMLARSSPSEALSASTTPKGSTKRNSEPRPGLLWTTISPPISSTSCLEMLKPSPVPP